MSYSQEDLKRAITALRDYKVTSAACGDDEFSNDIGIVLSHLQSLTERMERAENGNERYEKVRKMNPREFTDLWQSHLDYGRMYGEGSRKTFDTLVDEWKRSKIPVIVDVSP